jgi:hypothetical protein
MPTAEKKTLSAEGPSRTGSVPTADEKAAVAPRVAETPNGESDPEKIWQSVYVKIPNTKAFVRNSAAAAHVLPSEGRHFVLGFSPDQKSTMDILATATNRKLIETFLREVSGKDWTLKLLVQENLPSKGEPLKQNAPENYTNDPLIRDALEIFKGEIKR